MTKEIFTPALGETIKVGEETFHERPVPTQIVRDRDSTGRKQAHKFSRVDLRQDANACRAVTSMTKEIFTPPLGETIKVGEETKNFSLRLGHLRLGIDVYDARNVSHIVIIDLQLEQTKNFSLRLGDSIMATLRLSRVRMHSPHLGLAVRDVSHIVIIDLQLEQKVKSVSRTAKPR
jgi:hypothetical protein